METLRSIVDGTIVKKIKYEVETKNLIIADEQICGFFIRRRPPDRDNPVLEFEKLKENTKVFSYLCVYSTDKTIDATITIKNDVIKKGETEWIASIKLERERTSGETNLTGIGCYLSIVIGNIVFVSNPFLLRTNQTQVVDRSILNIYEEKESKPIRVSNNPRSAIHSSLLRIKNTVDKIDKKLNESKLGIKVYVRSDELKFKNLFSKLAEIRGITFVYNEHSDYDMVLLQNDYDTFLTDKRLVTENELISML